MHTSNQQRDVGKRQQDREMKANISMRSIKNIRGAKDVQILTTLGNHKDPDSRQQRRFESQAAHNRSSRKESERKQSRFTSQPKINDVQYKQYADYKKSNPITSGSIGGPLEKPSHPEFHPRCVVRNKENQGYKMNVATENFNRMVSKIEDSPGRPYKFEDRPSIKADQKVRASKEFERHDRARTQMDDRFKQLSPNFKSVRKNSQRQRRSKRQNKLEQKSIQKNQTSHYRPQEQTPEIQRYSPTRNCDSIFNLKSVQQSPKQPPILKMPLVESSQIANYSANFNIQQISENQCKPQRQPSELSSLSSDYDNDAIDMKQKIIDMLSEQKKYGGVLDVLNEGSVENFDLQSKNQHLNLGRKDNLQVERSVQDEIDQLNQKREKREERRAALANQKLDVKQLYDSIDCFRAGTFKFERNINYRTDIEAFKKEIGEAYDKRKESERMNYAPAVYNDMRKNYVESQIKERKADMQYLKTYVPIFPFMYQTLECGKQLGERKNACLRDGQIIMKSDDAEQYELVHTKLAVKFSIRNNQLLDYEESRYEELNKQKKLLETERFSNYQMNIEFSNVKSMWIMRDMNWQRDKRESRNVSNFQLLLQLKRPCEAMKYVQVRKEQESYENNSEEEVQDQSDQRKHKANKRQGQSLTRDAYNKSNKYIENNISPARNRSQDKNQQQKDKSQFAFKPSIVRSPFNMMSNLESDIMSDEFSKNCQQNSQKAIQANYSTLINYWNNNQVIQLMGNGRIDTLELLIQSIKKVNPYVKIHDYRNQFEDLDVQFLSKEELRREIKQLEDKGLNFHTELIQMRPSLRYAILALLSANKFNIFNQGLIQFMKMLNLGNWNQTDSSANYGAYLIDHINQFKEVDFKHDSYDQIEQQLSELMLKKSLLNDFKKIYIQNSNFICQRRVLITPTLYHFTVAKAEEGNKVLRQYRTHLSQFIKLTFVSDQMDKGFYHHNSSWSILGYIHSILKNGFFVGRNLKNCFLSYSNSQLKNHTCWYLACIKNGVTEKQIIDSMGEFEHEKNILKRYARRGQCFSTTKKICNLDTEQVCQTFPDIERNNYCFSDGCGYIHPQLAEQIAKEFKHSYMSAFQIRIGGAKGVLAAISEDSCEIFNQQGQQNAFKVLLRSSQVKFPSQNLTLEIVRCATFSQGYLNRQLIVLLHNLGVPIKYFIKKQRQAIRFLQLDTTLKRINKKIEGIHKKFGNLLNSEQILLDESLENKLIPSDSDIDLLKNMKLKDLAKDMKLSIEPCRSFQSTIKQSLIKGMDVRNEPVFSSVLHTMQLNHFMNLKKKARIMLPESCVLIGIIDPTDTLQEDEVFVQLRKDSFSIGLHGNGNHQQNRMQEAEVLNNLEMHEIIVDDVLVSRNPCTHPGDIRLLKCVDRPELRYLFNVIVFSSKGDRPQCNKMSGGDLDGDVYFVTWDKEMLQYVSIDNIHEPADYSKAEVIKEKPNVINKEDELADYFVFYLQRDVLGVISNLWLQLSEHYGQKGPEHENCLKLSHMASVAVDFAKHGESVAPQNYRDMQKIIKDVNPDFMERANLRKGTLVSEGVLGQLYRDVTCTEPIRQFICQDWINSVRRLFDIDTKIIGLVGKEQSNIQKMHAYLEPCFRLIVQPMQQRLKKIMSEFQICCEGQLFACNLQYRLCIQQNQQDMKIFYQGDPGNKQEDSIKNLNCLRRALTEDYQIEFNKIIQQGLQQGDQNAKLNVAVALYLATYFDYNQSGILYKKQYQNDVHFRNFLIAFENSPMSHHNKKFMNKIRAHFNLYHMICSDAELGDAKKMRKVLQAKKLFSIPWLLAGDMILSNYPDRYSTPEFQQKVRLAHIKRKNKLEKAAKAELVKANGQDHNSKQGTPVHVLTKANMKTFTKDERMNYIFNKIVPERFQNKTVVSSQHQFTTQDKENINPQRLLMLDQKMNAQDQVDSNGFENKEQIARQISEEERQSAIQEHIKGKSFLQLSTELYSQFVDLQISKQATVKRNIQMNDVPMVLQENQSHDAINNNDNNYDNSNNDADLKQI